MHSKPDPQTDSKAILWPGLRVQVPDLEPITDRSGSENDHMASVRNPYHKKHKFVTFPSGQHALRAGWRKVAQALTQGVAQVTTAPGSGRLSSRCAGGFPLPLADSGSAPVGANLAQAWHKLGARSGSTCWTLRPPQIDQARKMMQNASKTRPADQF